ncbi:MAG: flippase-like domain-containing protein [Taibaiella sp.]|nr:flippase-like domain-containing protein [Taibaiella sp.]
MNKSTKIWLNYSIGAALSVLLLWGIYLQVASQLHSINADSWKHTGDRVFIYACLLLMPVNICLEAWKWQKLASSATPISFGYALQSYMAGLAFSMVTPNRIGEYPGRILYMKRKNTFRLISVSILGAMAQMLALFVFGTMGLIYYNIAFPGTIWLILLGGCIVVTLFIVWLYLHIETWLPLLGRFKWARKYNIYAQLLKRFQRKEQLQIFLISLLRFGVFTAQYLFFLRWMNVEMPLAQGYCMASLFFWAIAIIPSIALAELGERGQVSLFIFHHFSANTLGILGATMGIWFLNLIIPSIIGSILLLRMRVLR